MLVLAASLAIPTLSSISVPMPAVYVGGAAAGLVLAIAQTTAMAAHPVGLDRRSAHCAAVVAVRPCRRPPCARIKSA
jgi:hypothetical protein